MKGPLTLCNNITHNPQLQYTSFPRLALVQWGRRREEEGEGGGGREEGGGRERGGGREEEGGRGREEYIS